MFIIHEITEEITHIHVILVSSMDIRKTKKTESVESLREWVLQEAEFQTKALEAVYGLTNTKQEVRRPKRENPHIFFGRSNMKIESNAERQHLQVC